MPRWWNNLTDSFNQLRYNFQSDQSRVRTERAKIHIRESNIRMSPEDRLMIGKMKTQTLREYSQGMHAIGGDLTTMFTTAVQDRRDYLEVADELKRFGIAKRILEILKFEVLKPNERGEIFEVRSERQDVDKRLKWFIKEHNLNNWLELILTDIMNLGEYTLAVESEEGVGITAIRDTVDQLNIVAFYDRGVPSNYLVWKRDSYYIEPPNKYCHFVIGSEKMRVALNDALHRGYQIDFDKLAPELKNKIPEFVRVGSPIFFSVVEKIRQLQILEMVVISIKISAVTQRKLVCINVPATMPIDQVMDTCQKMEETLNSQSGVSTDSALVTVNEIMSQAGRFTCIPNYTNDAGKLDPIDVRSDPQVDDIIAAIDDYRRNLLVSVGIPFKVVYGATGNETPGSRGEDVRAQAMYYNMISSLQMSLRRSLIQLCLIDLKNAGFEVKAEELDCVFLNTSVNVADLEKLEYDDAKQEIIVRKLEFIKALEESPLIEPVMNKMGIYAWLDEAFDDLTGGIPLFKPGTIIGDGTDVTDPPLIDGMTPLPGDGLESPQSKKDQVMAKVLAKFQVNRERRARMKNQGKDREAFDSDEPPLPGDGDTQKYAEHPHVKFMGKVTDIFKNNRKNRIGEDDPEIQSMIESIAKEFPEEIKSFLEWKGDLPPEGDNSNGTT